MIRFLSITLVMWVYRGMREEVTCTRYTFLFDWYCLRVSPSTWKQTLLYSHDGVCQYEQAVVFCPLLLFKRNAFHWMRNQAGWCFLLSLFVFVFCCCFFFSFIGLSVSNITENVWTGFWCPVQDGPKWYKGGWLHDGGFLYHHLYYIFIYSLGAIFREICGNSADIPFHYLHWSFSRTALVWLFLKFGIGMSLLFLSALLGGTETVHCSLMYQKVLHHWDLVPNIISFSVYH